MGVFGRLYNDRKEFSITVFQFGESCSEEQVSELKSRITEPVKERVRRYSGMRNDVNYLEATSAEEESGSVRSGAVPVILQMWAGKTEPLLRLWGWN